MRKPVVYSRSVRPPGGASRKGVDAPVISQPDARPDAVSEADSGSMSRPWRERLSRSAHDVRVLWTGMTVLAVLALFGLWQGTTAPARPLTQKEIDAAVLRTLTTQTLPSPSARAAQIIGPSVVQVMAYAKDRKGEEVEQGVGTGVVIVDKGIILTNFHVVQGADSLKVTFADGSESVASVTGAQPENDLAVLQAHTVPDDLRAATMRSTHDLLPGQQVVAVGFPFGIGPSTSAGVISGLDRSFRSPEGEQEIGNLIQFDAAANPGNSGGPLVTMDGEVVGIVTGILNPTSHRTFVGIGFAVPIDSAATAVGLPPF
ncbi:MAG: trypsin-like peptidase domain-containing protein [Burkholderiaceae bacterium]